MPIRFDQGGPALPAEVLQFKIDEPQYLIAGSDRSYVRRHLLHWLPSYKRNVPCTHEDCPWCPSPQREYAYVPVIWAGRATRTWKHGVLTLTEKMMPFLLERFEGRVWQFVRQKRFNQPPTWSLSENLLKPQPFVGFDVTPSLLRVWGMYAEFKRRVDATSMEGTLFSPSCLSNGESGPEKDGGI